MLATGPFIVQKRLSGENGKVLAMKPVTVEAPDRGKPRLFRAELPYEVGQETPGRLVVRDLSPAHGGDAHVASVEITLAP